MFTEYVQCAAQGSHYLRHHQHNSDNVSWNSRDSDALINSTSTMVRQREEAKIKCDLVNSSFSSKDKILWFHNEIEIDFGHRYMKDPRTGQITIVNVHFEDDGIWYCQDQETGLVGYPIQIIVLGKLFF